MQRNQKAYHALLIGWTFLISLMVVTYIVEFLQGQRTGQYILTFGFLAIIPLILGHFFYHKAKGDDRLLWIALVGYALPYVYALMDRKTATIFTYIIPMFFLLIVFHDTKLMIRYYSIMIGINVLSILYHIFVQNRTQSMDITNYKIQVAVLILCMISSLIAVKTAKQLQQQKIDVIEQNEKNQTALLDRIRETAVYAHQSTEEILEEIDHLVESSDHTVFAMQQIEEGFGQTANSIEIQSQKTVDIQENIHQAKKISDDIRVLSQQAMQKVSDGMENMGRLDESAVLSGEQSKHVLEKMEQLQQKTEEVMSIVSLIGKIAHMTNLLALNASIEAARAGEMGKGFAVVASEINQLSTQTKNATNEIEQKVNQLKVEAESACDVVRKMTELNRGQNEIIFQTEEVFQQINQSVQTVVADAEKQTEKVKQVYEANQDITESIQTISAVNQEVVASTQQTTETVSNHKALSTHIYQEIQDLEGKIKQLNE